MGIDYLSGTKVLYLFQIMTPKARSDVHVNLPALQKLDSILVVCSLFILNCELLFLSCKGCCFMLFCIDLLSWQWLLDIDKALWQTLSVKESVLL